MKETKIAKENVRIYKASGKIIPVPVEILEEHKTTCQRWLSFLIKAYGEDGFEEEEEFDKMIYLKVQDLKQAIKLYNEAGI